MINIVKKVIIVTKIFFLKHKVISTIVVLVLFGGGFWGYKSLTNNSGEVRYVLSEAVKGTIVSSISGTGQVSALDQIDIKPEVSGKIVYINLPKDKEVKAGTLLAQIDSRDAQKAVQSAENDLAGAKLSLTDINGDAKDALDVAYDGGLDALATTYKDLAIIKTNLDSMFLESSYGDKNSDIDFYLYLARFYNDKTNDLSFWTISAEQKYSDAQKELDAIEQAGWTINKNSQSAEIENAVVSNYNSVKTFLDLVRQASNLVQRYQKIYVSENLTTPIATAITASQATQLSDSLSLLVKDTNALLAAKSDIATKKIAFSKVLVDVKSQDLSIQQYENALADAKDNLAKYYMYAPINGVISASDSTVKVGDNVSSGAVLGSIITKNEVIRISLNEVDAVKIKTGQKATVAFDALPNLTATGLVVDVDAVGTVSQGVVSYGVKIALDIADDQIKPGMSGSINIITDTRQNVLTVPNGAVKSKNGSSYVLVLDGTQDLNSPTATLGFISVSEPLQKPVEIGLADDTNTEIIGGLVEGDQVVIRTISNGKSTTAPASSSATRQATQGLFGPGGR